MPWPSISGASSRLNYSTATHFKKLPHMARAKRDPPCPRLEAHPACALRRLYRLESHRWYSPAPIFLFRFMPSHL